MYKSGAERLLSDTKGTRGRVHFARGMPVTVTSPVTQTYYVSELSKGWITWDIILKRSGSFGSIIQCGCCGSSMGRGPG